LYEPDEYAEFQSDLAVYHDDYGDYSTNEPTMDGTASLIYLLAAKESQAERWKNYTYDHGGIIRGDSTKKEIALVFTGDEFADGGKFISKTLVAENVRASFFLTGKFYNKSSNEKLINELAKEHFLGNHSDKHLLYCDWNNRDSSLVDRTIFIADLLPPYEKIRKLEGKQKLPGVNRASIQYFLPPYEWYNDSISLWCEQQGIQLINYTPGTLSTADYTMPSDKNYRSSEEIYNSIIKYEQTHPSGLNGFVLLMHIGTDPKRTDKFYKRLPQLIEYLKREGYSFKTVDQMISLN
jgi:peptidoglycan/xylan/chitin deacetylase (PgdA/CDA1 family)